MAVDFGLYLITDRQRVPSGDLLDAVRAALDGGVRAVQLREKDLADRELLPLAEQLRDLTAAYRARLLINSRIEIALQVGADGLHLPSSSPHARQARRRLGPDRLLGISTHNLEEIRSAEGCGADFVTFGPVYATPSKLRFGEPLGVASLREACAATSLPVFALGGVTCAALAELATTGIAGVGLIRGILAAADPAAEAHRWRRQTDELLGL